MSEIIKNSVIAHRWPTAQVACRPGQTMQGGGGRCISLGGSGFVFFASNAPVNGNEWKISCDTPNDQDVMAEVYIICK